MMTKTTTRKKTRTMTKTRTRTITITTTTRTMAKTIAMIMIIIITTIMVMVTVTTTMMTRRMARTMMMIMMIMTTMTMIMTMMMMMVVVVGGSPPFAWETTWCPWAAPGILAKARRLQLADASFRDYVSFFPFFFVFIVQYSNIVLRNVFWITASTIEYNVSIIHFHIKLDVI